VVLSTQVEGVGGSSLSVCTAMETGSTTILTESSSGAMVEGVDVVVGTECVDFSECEGRATEGGGEAPAGHHRRGAGAPAAHHLDCGGWAQGSELDITVDHHQHSDRSSGGDRIRECGACMGLRVKGPGRSPVSVWTCWYWYSLTSLAPAS